MARIEKRNGTELPTKISIVTKLDKSGEALVLLAKSMDRLTMALEHFVGRDRGEHRELIILLKIIAGRLDHFEVHKNGN